MGTFIISAIIAFIVVVSIISSVKHFKGEGSCCGGGDDPEPRHKKIKDVKYTKEFSVEGMTCKHCKARVEAAVDDVDGVAGKVDLKRGIATVSYAWDVDDEKIKKSIEDAGYSVKGISEKK